MGRACAVLRAALILAPLAGAYDEGFARSLLPFISAAYAPPETGAGPGITYLKPQEWNSRPPVDREEENA